MKGVNKVMLVGNIGKDPEMQFLEGNIALARFSVATTEKFKDKSGKIISHTEWHSIVVWRGLAEMAQKFLRKGSLVYIEGRLNTRSWDDKEGTKRSVTEIIGENLVMLDKKNETSLSENVSIGNKINDLGFVAGENEKLPFD